MSPQQFHSGPHHSLAEDIAERLTQMIANGELHPHDQLPPERELAATLGVSRPSLREALHILTGLKIISRQHGRGTYVTSLNPQLLMSPLNYALTLCSSNVSDMFETRYLLEVGAARLAVQRASDEELQAITHVVADMESVLTDSVAFTRADTQLHRAIAAASHNPLLSQIIAGLCALSHPGGEQAVLPFQVVMQLHREHEAIVSALLRRDDSRVQILLKRHFETFAARPAFNEEQASRCSS